MSAIETLVWQRNLALCAVEFKETWSVADMIVHKITYDGQGFQIETRVVGDVDAKKQIPIEFGDWILYRQNDPDGRYIFRQEHSNGKGFWDCYVAPKTGMTWDEAQARRKIVIEDQDCGKITQ